MYLDMLRTTLLTALSSVLVCSCAVDVHADDILVKSVQISLIDQVEVAVEEAGVLTALSIAEGDVVQAGDVISQLDDVEAKLACHRVELELEIAAAEAKNELALELAEKAVGITKAELKRAEESNAKFDGAVTETELGRLRLACEQAELEVQQARHQQHLNQLRMKLKQNELEVARKHLDKRRCIAPLTGVVTRIDHQLGEWIQAGETFCEIVRTDRVRVEGYVSVSQGQVEKGQPVQVELFLKGRSPAKFSGVLSFVDPTINAVSQTYRVCALIENPQGTLRPGHPVSMRISNLQPATVSSVK